MPTMLEFVRTDRAPVDYLYLSRRLLTDLHEHDEAFRRPRRRKSLTFSFPGATATIEGAGPRSESLRAIARRSPELVSDQTGTVEQPGYYVRAELEMHHGVFRPHMGWDGGTVASYRGTVSTEDGPTAIALFGSARNVVGYRATDDGKGYCPSDIMGLYTLLDTVREPGDPEIDINFRIDDLGMDPSARAATAVHLAEGGARTLLGRMDTLCRVFLDEPEVAIRTGVRARVLIGTPLWIATPRPQPISH